MSQENVEVVRRAIDAWNRRDLAGIVDLAAPGIEYVNSPEAVEPGTKRGQDEVLAVFQSQWESLPGGRMDIDRLHDRGDEVIGVGRVSRLMPGSDTRVGNPVLMSWRVEDGRIIRTEMLGAGTRFQKALEAAGLSEQATSQENVAIVRRGLDAWNRRDWDEALKDAAPDVELDNSSTTGEWRGVYRGPDEVKRLWEKFVEPWESVRIEIDQIIEADNHIVARLAGHFVGRDGIEVTTRTAWCYTFRDGQLTRVLISNELTDALEAAGLRE